MTTSHKLITTVLFLLGRGIRLHYSGGECTAFRLYDKSNHSMWSTGHIDAIVFGLSLIWRGDLDNSTDCSACDNSRIYARII